MMLWDILIVGGGPAGVMAALGAKSYDANLSVAIIERNEFPQHRIGEALLTGTMMALDAMGVIPSLEKAGFQKKVGAAYLWGGGDRPWYVDYPNSSSPYPEAFRHEGGRYSLHVPRHKFDQVLKDVAIERGVVWLNERVTDMRTVATVHGSNFISLRSRDAHGMEKHHHAKYFIDATGHNAIAARGLTERRSLQSPRVAKYTYVRDIDWKKAEEAGYAMNRTNIMAGPNGWMWAIHLGEAGHHLTSVGFVSDAKTLRDVDFHSASKVFPSLKSFGLDVIYPWTHDGKLSDDGSSAARWYSHPDWAYVCDELHGGNWAIVGDAAMFLDPILSQGVTLAVHYGMMRGKSAAHKIIHGDNSWQEKTTMHYRREGAVLRKVIGEWYAGHSSVEKWKLLTGEMFTIMKKNNSPEEDGKMSPCESLDGAFRHVTNLENLRDEYDPFPVEVRRHISLHMVNR